MTQKDRTFIINTLTSIKKYFDNKNEKLISMKIEIIINMIHKDLK